MAGRGSERVSGLPFRCTGQRLDAETGLYYYKARHCDPETRQFLQTDPIGFDDQVNLYVFVGNDPVSHTDPTRMERDGYSMCKFAAGPRRRPRPIFCSDRFVILINTCAAVQNERAVSCAVMRRYFQRKGQDSGARESRERVCFASVLGSIGRHWTGFNLPQRFHR
jgi:RHS repeat-associated protein